MLPPQLESPKLVSFLLNINDFHFITILFYFLLIIIISLYSFLYLFFIIMDNIIMLNYFDSKLNI